MRCAAEMLRLELKLTCQIDVEKLEDVLIPHCLCPAGKTNDDSIQLR